MKSAKMKIIALSFAIVAVFSLFGVLVYALLNQSVAAGTYISISDKGQAKTNVVVSDCFGPSNNSKIDALTAEPQFELIIEKSREEDSKKQALEKNVEFSYKNYYRYYIIKVEITNLSTDIEIGYTINLLDKDGKEFVFSSQVEAVYMEKTGEGFQLQQCLNSGRLGLEQTKTTYVVFRVRDGVDLWDLSSVSKTNFTLKVEASA